MKRQAATARAVYHQDIEPTLHGRQLFIREQLEAFLVKYNQAPTALELLRFIAAKFPMGQFDCNSVRPRLRECWEQGWVEHAEKRPCRVTNKLVYTWRPSTPRVRVPEPVARRLEF